MRERLPIVLVIGGLRPVGQTRYLGARRKNIAVRGLVRDENSAKSALTGPERSLSETLVTHRALGHLSARLNFLARRRQSCVNTLPQSAACRVVKLAFSPVIRPTCAKLANRTNKVRFEEAHFESDLDHTICGPRTPFRI